MLDALHKLDGSLTILVIGVLVVMLLMWRTHKSAKANFTLFDLVSDNGKFSRVAAVCVGSFALTTWLIVRLTLDGKMTEGYFTTYSATWVAPIIAKLFSPASTLDTTTVSMTSTTTEEAKP